ncbi:hypothetical protein [Mycoplasmopsis felis]|uniref:hypothetical protein n=1 Tax=Mycoplasmopsis felis TaxID=33923 RepID=UPI002AFE821F|nr:hypothetical protein [Mycoplasmopsis felis]WQQ07567.1 hypothetical protein RRG57_02915 [Mycoplasmopsis felis]
MEKRCRKTKNEEKDAVIKYYQRIFYENDIEVDIKKIKELNKLSSKKKSKILCISRSTNYEKLKKEKVIVNFKLSVFFILMPVFLSKQVFF